MSPVPPGYATVASAIVHNRKATRILIVGLPRPTAGLYVDTNMQLHCDCYGAKYRFASEQANCIALGIA